VDTRRGHSLQLSRARGRSPQPAGTVCPSALGACCQARALLRRTEAGPPAGLGSEYGSWAHCPDGSRLLRVPSQQAGRRRVVGPFCWQRWVRKFARRRDRRPSHRALTLARRTLMLACAPAIERLLLRAVRRRPCPTGRAREERTARPTATRGETRRGAHRAGQRGSCPSRP
jgi:hypothetical protein